MKVLDLKCSLGHVFEGWFASETDFVEQCSKLLVQCPVCGDPSVVKKLSAPRLHLSGGRVVPDEQHEHPTGKAGGVDISALTDAWLAMARHVVANTTDVGERFAEEARQMHYGEQPERGIRGSASREEVRSLVDEGIDVLAFPLPTAQKGRLQ